MSAIRPPALAALALAVFLAGCSGGADRATAPSTTTTPGAEAGSTTAVPAGGTTAPSTPASAPTTTSASSPANSTPVTTGGPGAAATVASAGGWRMALTAPTAGSTVGSTTTLCYEVTGSSREASVAFDVTFIVQGPVGAIGPVRVDAAVGRGSARVNTAGLPPRSYDLRVQLVLDGARLEGATVTIPSITVRPGTSAAPACV